MGPLGLLDLHHPDEVRKLERSAKIIKFIEIERRVFGAEFDIVLKPGITDQLDERRPGGQQVSPERRLSRIDKFTKAVLSH